MPINNALSQKKVPPIDGIVGADILKKSKAILDYKSNKLYLKLWFNWFYNLNQRFFCNNISWGHNKSKKNKPTSSASFDKHSSSTLASPVKGNDANDCNNTSHR